MTLTMVNEKLQGSGYKVNPVKTKVRVENEDGQLLFYCRSMRTALNRVCDRCGGNVGGKSSKELAELFVAAYKVELTDELKKSLIEEAKRTWDYIAYDWLLMFDNHSCSAEDAREGVADRMENRIFYHLAHDQQEEILAAAITKRQAI